MAISKNITITEIAKAANVSIATVSRIINKTGNVKPETRQKVMDVMAELNFYPKSLEDTSSINSNSILVCLPNFQNPFNGDIIDGIQSVTINRGYRAFYYEARDFQNILSEYDKIVKKNNFSGILLVHNVASVELLEDLRLRYPVVMCSEHCQHSNVSFVSIDDGKAAENAVNYLISIGRKKIALLNSTLNHNYAKHREKGYLNALADANLTENQNWIAHISDINFEMAVSMATIILSGEEKPDAFFCISDVFAAAVIKAATGLGLSVPNDIAVVGFDNIDLASMTIPAITTIKQPSFHIGQQACELLINQIEDPYVSPKHVILNTELIVRDST